MRNSTTIRAASVVALVIATAGCGAAASPIPSTSGSAATSSAAPTSAAVAEASPQVLSGKIDVGGHSLYYACYGSGSPTVVLEHGLGGDLGEWSAVLPGITSRTRVCAYDRANVRGSDSVEGPRTVADSVKDLHALLGKASIAPPYVFVGFSWGGLVDQLYARTYPKEVAGLVLVDSNSADEARTYWAHLSPTLVEKDKQETAGPNPEQVDILKSFDLVRAAPALPDVPLVVVTHTVADPTQWPPGWDPATFDKLQAQLQAGLVKLTSKGSQVMAPGAGHDIPNDAPDVVSTAILKVVDAVAP